MPSRVPDAFEVTVYDKLDWHTDAALEAGQPGENAFTHIGFYLAWLIDHDLHDLDRLPADHVAAVKGAEMTGSDLADDIDGKLISDVLSPEGRRFSDARYRAYLDEYTSTFHDLPEYGVADEPANFARIVPAIDRLYATWVADGRPGPAPGADEDDEADAAWAMPGVMDGIRFGEEPTREQIEAVTAQIAAELGGIVVHPPGPEDWPHAAPDLEQMLPPGVSDPPLQVSSRPASEWGSSLLNRALKRLGVSPREAMVVSGLGGEGPRTLSTTLYGVPGVTGELLLDEFQLVIGLPSGGKWQVRQVAGRQVQWATGREFTVAFWTRDGLVTHVAGAAADVEAATPLLP